MGVKNDLGGAVRDPVKWVTHFTLKKVVNILIDSNPL